MKQEEYIFPFNERGNISKVKNTDIWKIHKKALNNKWTQEEKNKVFELLKNNTYFSYGIPLYGVCFNFLPILNRFWVKVKHYGVLEVLAPNKMSIRNYYGNSNVFEIVELKK